MINKNDKNIIMNEVNNINNIDIQNDNNNDEENDNEKENDNENDNINENDNNIEINLELKKNDSKEKNDIINYNNLEYEKKINYQFKQNPNKLKFKENIIKTGAENGCNDIFEIFISYHDHKEYLVSPNCNNSDIDIYSLIDHKKINSLKGHKKKIKTIRYFINDKNNNEYLVSGDNDKKVIVWDITKITDYKKLYNIDTKYKNDIFSCLLFFPDNSSNDYIITSNSYQSENEEEKLNAATKIYSFEDGSFIKYISNTHKFSVYYLLPWFNKKNKKYYVIQFCKKKILINDLFEDELYSELINEPESNHFSGFLFYKDDNNYLVSSSSNGYIHIWDLYEKEIIKAINLNIKNEKNKCKLYHIIEWNEKYIIAADKKKNSLKIIDRENNYSINNINADHEDEDLISIKKVYHPIYGESLLSAGRDKVIKLWTFE